MASSTSNSSSTVPLTPPNTLKRKQQHNVESLNVSPLKPKLLLHDLLQYEKLTPTSSPEKKSHKLTSSKNKRKLNGSIRRPIPNSTLSLDCYPMIKPNEKSHNKYLHCILNECQNIVVVAGAGISTYAGIPDFRSKNSGLYSKNKCNKSLMDLNMIYSNESMTLKFNELMVSLYSKSINAKITPFHQLLDKLAEQKRLKRVYTQNIDSLETKLPHVMETQINKTKGNYPILVQLHGNISETRCNKCNNIRKFDPNRLQTSENPKGRLIPSCLECEELESVRSIAGLRSKGVGTIRPTITLYNEVHNKGDAIADIINYDTKLKSIDLLIIVGTMLSIPHVKKLCQNMAHSLKNGRRRKGHVIFVSNEPPTQSILNTFKDTLDMIVIGDCQTLYNYID
ncbi:similar to Saccharomyces cerevisiae YDR191W HST4 Member of the Sir2 family of NAD(+)-dependent protein deacetylases [Maudiozyma saulgeensis]|uniref:Similar to Saccharomyces cerevisiae YDR191W HST4 Member of the Sir2 family of NAD(+)-dependent protein deacetylases n=1 Tax=Maudiozyma saulgeensis TaxID=1789683 RepID=A0A1X7R2F6_9SACH|nr:similar to Saccharomyces cerevisiae YDR191W HST4 Member of the Sir2 family of NAD(+)-dependent protein deacetylases [Kazachstania saulgeensis]